MAKRRKLRTAEELAAVLVRAGCTAEQVPCDRCVGEESDQCGYWNDHYQPTLRIMRRILKERSRAR